MQVLDIRSILNKIKTHNPMILNLTNHVVMNFTANVQLALGASPIMSVDISDAIELLSRSNAININIGTLSENFILIADNIALLNNKQKPLILDPVGAGASEIRTTTACRLSQYSTVIRGNAGEITALKGISSQTKGVDSFTKLNQQSIQQITHFAQKLNSVISISGQQDLVTYNGTTYTFDFGHELMTKITGMGCSLTGVIATFCAVEDDPFLATVLAAAFYGLCGELTYQKSPSLGGFQQNFIDTLHDPDFDYINSHINDMFRRNL